MPPNTPRGVDSHLKDRLISLAKGSQTIQRLISNTSDLLGSDGDDLTFENLDYLDDWLAKHMKAGNAEARIRWAIIRDVFVSFRALRN